MDHSSLLSQFVHFLGDFEDDIMKLLNQQIGCFWIVSICFIFTSSIFFIIVSYGILKHKNLPLRKAQENLITSERPNFIFFLTDDQDSVLNSMDIMVKVNGLIVDQGVTFTNSFVTSPLCCPSRSSILSGQYVHNHRAFNNSVNGGCSNDGWQRGPEKRTFVNSLHENGYKTFFAGKYLNQYGREETGGLLHIPPGWDSWVGLKGNSVYYNYSLSVNGSKEVHGDSPDEDYLTKVIEKRALDFINSLPEASSLHQPFFMMLSTPACHAPFDAEPKYLNKFESKKVPRSDNFNVKNDFTKHWLLRLGEQPLSSEIIDELDEVYRKRLRTLLSVDDMVESVVNQLSLKNLLRNTYLIFTSDNGYHLGQFSLPLDKREPYEFDIRVPFFISGPGITKRIVTNSISNIDLAPTILDLAGLAVPQHYDGGSFKDLLRINAKKDLNSQNLLKLTSRFSTGTSLIEHSGEGHYMNRGCEHLGPNLYGCSKEYSCKCSDSTNNTYACLRHINSVMMDNFLYCEWEDEENFIEYYNLNQDPFQLNNTGHFLRPDVKKRYSRTLAKLRKCHGIHCRKFKHFVF